MQKILFVCMGNICRSPAGEGVMQRLVDQRGLGASVIVDSAGTIGYHSGAAADSRMREAASRRGYELTSRARKVEFADLERFDLIVAMDGENLRNLRDLSQATGDDHIVLLSEFLDGDWPTDVPDPYYGGDEGFETVLDMIEAACPALLTQLLDSE